MKRREFLAGSIGAAGVLLPELALTETIPCGPPTVVVKGGTASSVKCAPDPAGMVPDWFAAMEDRTWTFVAAGKNAGPTFTDGAGVQHQVNTWQRKRNVNDVYVDFIAPIAPDSQTNGIIDSWCGGAVDDSTGDYLIFGGGHGPPQNNDVRAINLRSEQPEWRSWNLATFTRLANRVETGGTYNDYNSMRSYRDGQALPTHTWHSMHSIDGTLWLMGYDAAGGTAHTSTGIWKHPTGQPWQGVGLGAGWTMTKVEFDNPLGGSNYQEIWSVEAVGSAYDPNTRRIFRPHMSPRLKSTGAFIDPTLVSHVHTVHVDTGEIRRDYVNGVKVSGDFGTGRAGFAVPDKGLVFLAGYRGYAGYNVYDSNLLQTLFMENNNRYQPSATEWNGYYTCQYHQPSNAVFAWDGEGASIRKMTLPAGATGAAMLASGNLVVQPNVPPAPSNTVTPTARNKNGTHSRFHICRMGQIAGIERYAFVLINNVNEPVFVYKIPERGI